MPHARWHRAKQVFQEALDKARTERAQFVAAECGADLELRAQVEALIAAHDEAGAFMTSATGAGPDDPRAGALLTTGAGHLAEGPGTRVGPYKLLQVIGEGGFGVVYMAEQEQPIRRRVAIKIIKLGMDSKEVIARFEAERQALAMMDHPSIAKVLDAGATESGRPYFVMELVQGVPITDYCDANHLNTRERLDLFAEVCKAIHHTHEKGIIHRDIKPSNVMVTLHDGTPAPKIIDFGIAKATNQRLTEKTLFTAYGQFVGTPAYMSPEQTELSGLEIDRRADIYSLGVLLYEILTGTTPFEAETLRARGFVEVMRIIREEDPPTPSARLHTLGSRLREIASLRQVEPGALEKLVRGDLDWIVMKALDKDRRRRYASASELVDDLSRHFRDEPVNARRSSTAYRLRKFAKRRKRSIVAVVSVAGAIMLGVFAAKLGGLDRLPSAGPGPAMMRTRIFSEINDLTGGTTDRAFLGVSPDGTKALVADYTTGENLAAYDFATHTLTQLTQVDKSTEWACCGSAWSPQNNAVAYSLGRQDNPYEVHVSILGGSSKMIFRDDSHTGRFATVAGWFPDGSKVLVSLWDRSGAGAIGSVPASGGPFTQIVSGDWGRDSSTPALSPAGQFIAFAELESGEAHDIHIISVDGKRRYRVTDDAADDSSPMWSPDGRHVAFISNRGGSRALWAVRINGGEPVGRPFKIKDGIGMAWPLNWNSRGIVFSESLPVLDIFTSVRDSSTAGGWAIPKQLPYEHTGRNSGARFSPDGTSIAFLARDPTRWSSRRVVVQGLEGGRPREYPVPDKGSPGFVYVRWFGNGRGLGFFGEDLTGARALHRLTLATGEWQTLPVNIDNWSPIEWNEDGSAFYLVRTRGPGSPGIYEHDIKTGLERAVYQPSEPFANVNKLRTSPDRQWLCFVQSMDEKGVKNDALIVLNLTTGERRQLTTIRSTESTAELQDFAWDPGNGAIAGVVGKYGGPSEVRLAAIDGSGVRVLRDVLPRSVTRTSFPFVQEIDWSADGRRMAFVVNDGSGSAFVIENPLSESPVARHSADVGVDFTSRARR